MTLTQVWGNGAEKRTVPRQSERRLRELYMMTRRAVSSSSTAILVGKYASACLYEKTLEGVKNEESKLFLGQLIAYQFWVHRTCQV